MMDGKRGTQIGALTAVVAVAALAVGCGGANPVAPDKVGDPGQNHLTLTIATGEGEAEEARWYQQAIAAASNGTIEVKIDNTTIHGQPNYEELVIRHVADGKAELGFTAARAFDEVGVNTFVGLHAPFQIDSYELEDHVLSSDWAHALLDGTRSAGVVGVGYIQGAMRRPVGISRDLLATSDFKGARIGIRPSAMTEITMKALGATPVAFAPGDLSGLDGVELNLALLDGDYRKTAKSLTSNVVLFSRPGVIFVNTKTYDGLTPAQRELLQAAGDRAFRDSVASIAKNSDAHAMSICSKGLPFVASSAAALADLRAAVQPVYDEISTDAATKATIENIEKLKGAEAASSAAVTCAASSATPTSTPPTAASAIDGTWHSCYNHDEFMAAGPDQGEDNPGNIGCGSKTFRGGRFWELRDSSPFNPAQPNGSFTVTGTTVTLLSQPDNEAWTFDWSIFGDTLTFKRTGNGGPTGFVVKPWQKVEDARSPIDGTYATSFTKAELAASPLLYDAGEINDENWGDFTLLFKDGVVTFSQRNEIASYTTSGTYSVTDGDVVMAFTAGGNDGETFEGKWSLFRDTLTFERDGKKELPTPYVVKAWTKAP